MSAVLLAWILSTGEAARAWCTDYVLLDGDPKPVREMGLELEQRGIRPVRMKGRDDPRATSGVVDTCVPLVAVLQIEPTGVDVTIVAPGTLPVKRALPNAESAATFVESWVRADIAAPLLEGASRRPMKPIRPPENSSPREVAETPTPPRPRPLAVTLGGIVGLANDGSIWTGAELTGCFRMGWVCVGGRLQYAKDLALSGMAAQLDGTRSAVDVGLLADVPLRKGNWELAPGLGVGTTLFQTRSGSANDETGGLRLRGQWSVAWLFSETFELRATAAVDYAPFATEELFESTMEGGPETVPIPGEPKVLGWLRLGFGMRGM